ncbi:MAG: hypothetical protein KDA61_08955, partial [Planctomycetales bacterium]|nr:hypothetical protein [Planctomycetales bacterium]
TAEVAQYLWLDAMTPASQFFASCRKEPNEREGRFAPLRTFALHRVASATEDAISYSAAQLRRQVVRQWAGGDDACEDGDEADGDRDSGRDTNQIVRGVGPLVGRMQLQVDGLAANARSLIESQLGGEPEHLAQTIWEQIDDSVAEGKAAAVRNAVDKLFVAAPEESEGTQSVKNRPLDSIVSPLSMKLATNLSQWILARLDDRQERLLGAERSTGWLIEHFECVERDSQRLSAGFARQLNESLQPFRDAAQAKRSVVVDSEWAANYLRLHVDKASALAAAVLARRMKLELRNVKGALVEFGRHLRSMAEGLAAAVQDEFTEQRPPENLLSGAESDLTALVDEKMEAFIAEQGGLFQTLMGNTRVRGQMLEELTRQSVEVVRGVAMRRNPLDSLLAADDEGRPMQDLAALAESVSPDFLCQGGTVRRLAVLPAADPRSETAVQLKSQLSKDSTVIPAGEGELTLCSEAWDLAVPHLALELIQSRRDYVDFASRVQTRSDVAWGSLIEDAVDVEALSIPPAKNRS